MRTLLVLCAATAVSLAPAPARAQLVLGARLGWAFPGGKVGEDSAGSSIGMSELAGGVLPVQVEAGVDAWPDLELSLYASWGPVRPSSQLDASCAADGVHCSGYQLRFGIQTIYVISPSESLPTFRPWLGVGTGLEWMSVREEAGDRSDTTAYSGWEVLNLQLGLDLGHGNDDGFEPEGRGGLHWGPFASFGLGQYFHETRDVAGASFDGSIPHRTFHGFLELGIRGRLGF